MDSHKMFCEICKRAIKANKKEAHFEKHLRQLEKIEKIEKIERRLKMADETDNEFANSEFIEEPIERKPKKNILGLDEDWQDPFA